MTSLMLRSSQLAAAVAALAVFASGVNAQTGAPVQVRGVVYDSLRSEPLAGAVVSLVGDTRIVRADNRGRFVFDSVMPGARTFAAQHAAVDSLGFSGISTRVNVAAGMRDVVIASPSFATLWHAACGSSRPPKDSGFVYGTIRNAATENTVPNATVEISWIDLRVDRGKRISQSRWTGESESDSTGAYAICGIPRDVGLRIRASADSSGSGSISLIGTGARVQRRDLMIGTASFDSALAGLRGAIAGSVTDSGGKPIVDARVIADGAPELRTDANGRFTVRDVPIGSRQVEILSIGMSPVLTVADVTPNDTALINASMRKITTLDVIRVTASPATRRLVREIDERRHLGGYFRDSTEIANHGSLFSVLFEFPNVEVRRNGATSSFVVILPGTSSRKCLANVIIDNRKSDFDELNFLRPSDIAVMEVYPRRMRLPMQFIQNDDCGAVVVWTKWSLGS